MNHAQFQVYSLYSLDVKFEIVVYNTALCPFLTHDHAICVTFPYSPLPNRYRPQKRFIVFFN